MVYDRERVITVGLNSNFEEIKKVLDSNESKYIKEIFVGGLKDFIGYGGRISTGVLSIEDFKEIVNYAHKRGVKVNVAANNPNLDPNLYYDTKFLENFKNKVIEMGSIGIDSLTLADGQLIRVLTPLIKSNKFKLPKISTSVYTDVRTPLLAREFSDLGVDRIIVPQDINRDIQLFERMLKYNSHMEFELYVNSKCSECGNCPVRVAHRRIKSVMSDEKFEKINPNEIKKDIIRTYCINKRNTDGVNNIFIGQVRPEDLDLFLDMFEKYNIKDYQVKLACRGTPVDLTIKQIKAYGERSFDGYFSELWTVVPKASGIPNKYLDGLVEKLWNVFPEEQRKIYKEIWDLFENNENSEQLIKDYISDL